MGKHFENFILRFANFFDDKLYFLQTCLRFLILI